MDKIKKIIIILICIIILLIMATIIIIKNKQDGDISFFDKEIEEQELVEEPKNTIQISDYFRVKDCIQNFVDIANIQNSIYYDKQEDGNQIYNGKVHKEILYTMLNEAYIKENNITVENVFNYVKTFNTKQRFYPTSVTILAEGEIVKYKVTGIVQDLDYKSVQEVYCGVSFCNSNNAFSIWPLDKNSFKTYTAKENIAKIDEKEGYNICNLSQINDEIIAIEYFEAYRFLTLANPNYTYNMMTEEYRNKRFGTYENYVQYVKDNYNELKEIIPKRYLSTFKGQYTQYVVQDQYGNNYIFDTLDATKYNVSLDTYTIDEEKFKTTYNSADEGQRVQMNIDKFFDMINRQDYRTSYRCLDNTFKKNNYNNEKVFEKFIKSKLFKYNKYSVKELKSVGSNTYACRLYISDKTIEDGASVQMTVIMKLLEGTDFTMSFSMN